MPHRQKHADGLCICLVDIGEGWCVELKLTVLLETMFHTQCVGT